MKTTELLEEMVRFNEEKYGDRINEVILDYNTWYSLFEEVRQTLNFTHMNNCSHHIVIQFTKIDHPVTFLRSNKRGFVIEMIPELFN